MSYTIVTDSGWIGTKPCRRMVVMLVFVVVMLVFVSRVMMVVGAVVAVAVVLVTFIVVAMPCWGRR